MLIKILTPLIALVASFLFIFSCQKQINENFHPEPGPVPPDRTVVSGFQGRVLDENAEPVKGVLIKAGGKSSVSDINGIFRIDSIKVSQQFGYVQVEKEGYFNGSRTVIANEGGMNFVEIQLMKKELKGNIDGLKGGDIIIANGTKIQFPDNSFVTEAGINYPGTVKVFAALIDPTAPNFSAIMPGDLRGITTSNEVRALISYGMVSVLLEGSGGEKIQLAKGKPAVLNMEIPSALLADAPASIPLWYFDETNGKWKEEGSAVKIGQLYSGTVSHFSTWNCDVPADFVNVTMEVQNQQLEPLAYRKVKITDTRNNRNGIAFTDSAGFLSMWVPKSEQLEIQVINACNEILSSKNIGPFSADANLGKLTVDELESSVVIGTALNCEGQPLQNGYVSLLLNGLYYRANVINGEFRLTVNKCKGAVSEAEIYVLDFDSRQKGAASTISIGPGETNAGVLYACDQVLTQFCSFELDSKQIEFHVPPDSISYTKTGRQSRVFFMNEDLQGPTFKQISVTMADTVPHTFNIQTIILYVNRMRYHAYGNIKINVTKFGKVNEFIELNFDGQVVKDSTNIPLPFKGEMRFKRPH